MMAARTSRRRFVVGGIAAATLLLAGFSIAWQLTAKRPVSANRAQWLKAQTDRTPQRPAPKTVAERVSGPAGRIVPAHLVWRTPNGASGLVSDIEGCLPAGPGVDVLWQRGNLFLMRERGHLEVAWAADRPNENFSVAKGGATCVCFDGKYVWAMLARHARTPLLVVVDPSSGKSWTFGVEDGLPVASAPGQGDPSLVVGPIAPGKACVATCSLPPRYAVAQFEPDHGVSFRELSPPAATGAPPSLAVAIFSLAKREPSGKSAQRIVILGESSGAINAAPTIVDPDSLSVEIAPYSGIAQALNGSNVASLNDALYWVARRGGSPPGLVLARETFPRFEEEWLLNEMPEGKPAAYGDGLALLGDKCWLWKPGEKQVRSIAVDPPWSFRSPYMFTESSQRTGGEEWELRQAFASQHYGVLAKAVKKTGPNSYFMDYTLFQFALADDPRLPPATPLASEKRRPTIDFPPGTTSSELQLFAGDADDVPSRAEMPKPLEGAVDGKYRYPLLAREVVRQALLIAAREQRGWATRDELLGESLTDDVAPAARFVLTTRFPYSGAAEFELRKTGDDGKSISVWREQLVLNENDEQPLDYALLAESAERWSRETFPAILSEGTFAGEPTPLVEDAAVSPGAEEWLHQFAFTAQCAVVRELHHGIRRQGESDALLAALVRGYANLGVLSEFHWNAAHKALKARALVYAQRLAARRPQAAVPLRHRAYAKALIGLHDSAADDFEAAGLKDAAGEASEPAWVQIAELYCRFQTGKLAACTDGSEDAQLAALLHFFHLESLKESTAVQTLARGLLKRNPEDFRLFDAMCDSCAIDTLHAVTQLAPMVLETTTPARLKQLSGLPSATTELLRRDGDEADVTELAESLMAAPADEEDGEFSWRILGRMLQETEFIQLWRRASFMRFQWSVPTGEFLDAVTSVARGHRFRPLLDVLSTDARTQSAAAEALVGRIELEEIDYAQQRALSQAMRSLWQTGWTEHYALAEHRPALHMDDVHRDLLRRMEEEQWRAASNLATHLGKISSRSPDALAARLRQERTKPLDLATLEKQYGESFGDSPQFWKALSDCHFSAEDRKMVYRRYIELSPDAWAYRALAGYLQREGKLDEWQATLDECLRQPAFGLEHAQLRVQIANHFMELGQWEQARPYAAEAAETWAEWAMLCAVHCYQGLEEDEEEGLWRARLVERYPKLPHWLNYYTWSRRTGLGDSDLVLKTLDPLVAAAADGAGAELRYSLALFYQLSKQPRKALAIYQKGVEDRRDVRTTCFNNLWTAALAQELGEPETRDKALARIGEFKDPAVATYLELVAWIKSLAIADHSAKPDLAAARKLIARAADKDRPTVNAFVGRFLDLHKHADAAIEFYRQAVAAPEGRFSATCQFVAALLRERSLDPGAKDKSDPSET